MSIRLRLTLLYTTILALTLIGFSTALYVTVDLTTTRVLQDGFIADMSRLLETKDFRLTAVAYMPSGKGKPIPWNTYVQTLLSSMGTCWIARPSRPTKGSNSRC